MKTKTEKEKELEKELIGKCKICGKKFKRKSKNDLKNICWSCYKRLEYIKKRDLFLDRCKNRKQKRTYKEIKESRKKSNRDNNWKISVATFHKYGKAKKCQICNSEEDVQHHHFKPYHIDNFIDVCKKCHGRLHRKTKQELIEELFKNVR